MLAAGADEVAVTLELIRVEQADDPWAFRTGVQEYMLRADEGTYATATLTWDDALLRSLAELRAPGRDPALVQALGERLRRLLMAGRLATLEDRIARAHAERRRVRVEVVSGAAELCALPWELLTIGGRHLGELPGVEIQYRWPGAQAVPPARPPAQEGGRVLVAWSRGGSPLGEQFTIDAIAAAMRAAGLGFDPARDVVADASLPAIVAAIEAGVRAGDPPAALHLLCHGAPVGAGYGLRLDDGRGGATVVDGRTLRGALAPFAEHLRLVVLLACDSGNPGVAGARLGSAATELHRVGFAAVVAARYPVGGAAALAFTRQLYEHMLSGPCSIEQAFRAVRERLVREGSGDWSTFQLYSHAGPGGTWPFVIRPYRGLLAFEREHAALLFGREAELAETLQDLDALIAAGEPRLLAIVGASGTGKSSLALASVRVALERRGWHVAVLRPGRAPNEALAEALRGRPAERAGALIVDQFEEVFTHCVDAGRVDEATAFVRALWRLAADTVVLVTLRVDYLGRCGDLVLDDLGARFDRVVYDEAHRVFIAQMSPAALRTIIERPAQRVGLRVEPGLPERLVAEVARESNALPLLEYVLDELWRRRAGDLLTHAALEALGGVTGALARHADAVVDALDEPARAQAQRTLVRLVTYGGDAASGARLREDEQALRSRRDPGAWDRAAHALIAARLVVRREEAAAAATLEIAHEALIRRWDRLWRWYEAERDRLGRRRELDKLVEQWQQYGPLAGKALALAQALVRGLDEDDVAAEARTMLAASEARARREVRTRRALVGAALATLSAFAIVVGALYLQADRSARRSQASQRVASAGRFVASRPHLAAALLRSVDEPGLPGWRQTVVSTLQAPLPTVVADVGAAALTAAALAPDGGVVVGHRDGPLQLFPPDGPPAPAIAGPRPIVDVAVSPDGASVYVLRPPQLEVWDRASASQRGAVDVDATASRLQVGAETGRILVVGSAQSSLWAPAGDRLEARGARPRALAIDPARERSLRADGDDAAVVETWSGGQVGRHASPGIGRAWTALVGVYHEEGDGRVTAWSWAGDAEPVRRELDTSHLGEGLLRIAALPDRTVFQAKREAFGIEATVLCAQTLADPAARCVELAPGCYFGGLRDRLARIDCADHVQLRRVETLAVSATLAGPDAMRSYAFDDGRGRVALFAVDRGQLWRWDVRRPPSGLTLLDREWTTIAPLGYTRVPTLQAERGRIAAVLWDSDLRIETWQLRPDTIAAEATSVTLDVPLAAGDEYPREHFFSGDAFLVRVGGDVGSQRLIVGTLGAQITSRSVRLDATELSIQALAGDGQRAYGLRGDTLVRLDLRGDAAREEPIAGGPWKAGGVTLAPHDRYLALHDDAITLVDLARGVAISPDPDLDPTAIRTVAFAPDGVTLALGARAGPVTVARVRDDGTLQPLGTLLGLRGSVEALAFSADGRALVGGDGARQVCVWTELESAQPRALTVEVPEPIWHVGLSPGGEQLWALSQLGELRFWSLYGDDAALRRELAARSTYCLSPREWTELADVPAAEAEAVARAHCPAARAP